MGAVQHGQVQVERKPRLRSGCSVRRLVDRGEEGEAEKGGHWGPGDVTERGATKVIVSHKQL